MLEITEFTKTESDVQELIRHAKHVLFFQLDFRGGFGWFSLGAFREYDGGSSNQEKGLGGIWMFVAQKAELWALPQQ